MTHCYKHNCIEELTADHEKILAKVDELEKEISPADRGKIKEFLHFAETFVDPHLQKEEKVLFPALEKKGIPKEGGPIGMMLFEHETKRGYVKKLQKALAKDEEEEIKEYAQAIVSLLRDHIFKEDNILYPCARDVLTSEELVNLGHQCQKIK